jgi:hypothetical protein
VVEHQDGTVEALTGAIEAVCRAGIPAQWVGRMLEANLAGVPFEVHSGGVYEFMLDQAWADEIGATVRTLSRRREFASVRPMGVLLSVPAEQRDRDADQADSPAPGSDEGKEVTP